MSAIQINNTEEVVISKKKNPFLEFWKRLRKNKLAIVGLAILVILTFVSVFAPYIAPYDPDEGDVLRTFAKPDKDHWLGTDEVGRDVFSRIIHGSRISLKVGFLAVGISMVMGIIFGCVSGYYGGIVDAVIMRIMDMIMAFPSILLAIVFMSVLGKGIENAILAISIVSIPGFSRIVRGSVMSVKENDYIQSARAIGCNNFKIMFVHILPNVLSPIIINASMSISGAILQTAALGFLGLGVKPPTAEWGSMLASGKNYIFNAPHVLTFPGIAISITVLSFNLLGDGLRDALDPRLKQ